jgi:hypothetical protein
VVYPALIQDLRSHATKPADQQRITTEERSVEKSRKITDLDSITFLVTAPCNVSCVKAAACYAENGIVVAHDKINRFLTRPSMNPETLWNEVERYVEKRSGWLIPDDTVIDKIHSNQIEVTYYQWSGNHHNVVKGLGLISRVWTAGISPCPIDYRIYDKGGMRYRRTIISVIWSCRLHCGDFSHTSSCSTVGIPVSIT